MKKKKLGIIKRDQPSLRWMKREGSETVFGIKIWSRKENKESGLDISGFPMNYVRYVFVFDPLTEKLRPVVFQNRHAITDYSLFGKTAAVLFKDEEQLHLFVSHSGMWQEELLRANINAEGDFRILLSDNMLFLFSEGGVFVRYAQEWQPFTPLYGKKHHVVIPEFLLNANEAIYVGYDTGEYGGAVYKFIKSLRIWEDIEKDYLANSYIYSIPDNGEFTRWTKGGEPPSGKTLKPRQVRPNHPADMDTKAGLKEISIDTALITGIRQGPGNHVWISTGSPRFQVGALYEFNENQWGRIIPDKINCPGETDINGIDFMPTGELRLVAGSLGIFEIKDEKLNPIFEIDWNHHGKGIYCVDLVIDQEGRNFVGTDASGVILCRGRDSTLDIQRLTFDPDTPVIHLEDIMGNII